MKIVALQKGFEVETVIVGTAIKSAMRRFQHHWISRVNHYAGNLLLIEKEERVRKQHGQWLRETTIPAQQDEFKMLLLNASSLAEIWAFFLKRLNNGSELDLLCLSILSGDEKQIDIRFFHKGSHSLVEMPEVQTIAMNNSDHPLVKAYSRKDTSFTSEPDMPQLLQFNIPLIAGGRSIAMLTLGFHEMDTFSKAKISYVYSVKDRLGQLIWSLLLQERLYSIQNEIPPTLTLSPRKMGHFSGPPLQGGGDLDLNSSKKGNQFETSIDSPGILEDDVTLEIITSLSGALEAKDYYTRGHSQAVANYAVLLATALKMTPAEIAEIRAAAFLHDIGKIGIPGSILRKVGMLNEKEWTLMKQHPVIGAQQILYPVQSLRPLIPAVECHHENWDGSGHPHGLKGEKIPLGARIISIVDVFHALTSNRSYRNALSASEAQKILNEGSGIKWDPHLLTLFFDMLKG